MLVRTDRASDNPGFPMHVARMQTIWQIGNENTILTIVEAGGVVNNT